MYDNKDRGSSDGFNALLVLEGKFDGKRTRGRPRRTWIDDVIQWIHAEEKSMMYDEVQRLAEDRNTWRKTRHQPYDTEYAYDE